MVDENLLKQLENSLILYQETQETLDVVVQNAQFAFGDEWLEKLPLAFDNVQMDTAQKIILKDKANHVVHYYGALVAWQEASAYLSDPTSVTAQLLAERIPTLEYWLALFGNEGSELLSQVKDLYHTLNQAPAEQLIPSETQPDVVAEEQKADFVEDVIPEQTPSETPVSSQDIPSEIAQTEETTTLQQPLTDQEQIVQIMPESFRGPEVLPQETTSSAEELVVEENQTVEIIEESEKTEEQEVLPSVEVQEQSAWQDRNTDGEMDLEGLVDFNIPSSVTQIPTEEFIDAKEVMQGETQMVTQNWDLANFLRQKRLYDDANNWLSAWCIRMDNSEKTDYPHYGFIVDIMHDLKEKIQIVLENQLLEELVEREIPGGQEAMNRLLDAINKELEDLPDDFKIPTAEKIKLNAKEILGAIDNSSEREFIGPAPDGFELMDDPYAASTEQILSDFEKAEEEAQNQIDKLNVIEENENKQEKD